MKRRQFHVGLELGTASASMVLRDLERPATLAQPVMIGGTTRLSTFIGYGQGVVSFGCEPRAQGIRQLRVRVAQEAALSAGVPDFEMDGFAPCPIAGTTYRELATMLVWRLLGLARLEACVMADLEDPADVDLSVTLGLPLAWNAKAPIRDVFERVIGLGSALARDLGPYPHIDCELESTIVFLGTLPDQYPEVVGKPADATVVPEVHAAALWPLRASDSLDHDA